MFQWYRNAQVCYAYLSDVHSGGSWPTYEELRLSKWFTRGWTLQELLAPHTVVFFNHDWVDIGTKYTLQQIISSITGIKDLANFEKASVAQKMSWASNRHTTRVEDKAYCLMGLFGINMPLLYGEGQKAFFRLQLEILNISDDESIFAWEHNRKGTSGMLAHDPSLFRRSGDVVRLAFDKKRTPYSMTHKGLRIELMIARVSISSFNGPSSSHHLAPLNCALQGRGEPLAIYLTGYQGQIQRARCDELAEYNRARTSNNFREVVYVKQEDEFYFGSSVLNEISISTLSLYENGFSISLRDRLHFQHGKGPDPIKLSITDGNGFATLLCTKFSEKFIIVLYNFTDHLGVKVLVPPESLKVLEVPKQTKVSYPSEKVKISFPSGEVKISDGFAEEALEDSLVKSFRPFIPQSAPDRISELLPSGTSVSVTIKRGFELNQLIYLVDITIHADGRMEWPQPVVIKSI
jgi:hypothetical protein